jgi:2-octaprenyl-3-methyl-6-methoxy-1,4-benzoquinol hydroxylase
MTGARRQVNRGVGLDAIVVGAGVVGSATALGLAQAGLRVALVEARAPTGWRRTDERDLRVFAFAPGSSRLLSDLGVWNAVRGARAHPYCDMRVWDAADTGELHFRAAELGVDALGHIVEQNVLQDALWRALTEHSDIDLCCPASVVGMARETDAVALELEDGRRLFASVAIAADGADSPLRERAGIEVRGHAYGQRGLVAYVRTEQPHGDTAWQRFLPGGPLALLPCDDELGSIVWSLPEAEAERLLGMPEPDFEAELTRAFDARLGAMRLASRRAAFPLRLQLASQYAKGRIVLIGDAAHVVHPLAGQGVNLGLQDARELVATLRRAHQAGRDLGADVTLRRYERVRRSDNAIAAYTFDGIHRLFSNDAFVPTLLRGPALGLVDRLTPLKQLLARHAMGLSTRESR